MQGTQREEGEPTQPVRGESALTVATWPRLELVLTQIANLSGGVAAAVLTHRLNSLDQVLESLTCGVDDVDLVPARWATRAYAWFAGVKH